MKFDPISYALHFGGRCRDCADNDGVCPTTGLPCDTKQASEAVQHCLSAWQYGIRHGYIDNPFVSAPPAPQMTGRWRMFEEATGPGYWGIELEDAGNDDDAILYPIKAHRDTIARIVEAHNAALATSEGRSELADKYDTGTTS